MKNKKQIVGFSLLAVLSVAFVVCCLFLPLFYTKFCSVDNGEIIEEASFSFFELVKQDVFGLNIDLSDYIYFASGPVWLTIAMIYINIITMFGCCFLFVLSIIGLVCSILTKYLVLKIRPFIKLPVLLAGLQYLPL